MDKKTIVKMIDDRAKGEKTRVLFDLLMEAIGANFEMKQHEVFELIKLAIEAEQEAIKTLMSMSQVEVPEQGSDEIPDLGMRSSAGSSPADE